MEIKKVAIKRPKCFNKLNVLATLLGTLITGCHWVSLGYQALTYPTTTAQGMSNVVILDHFAYLATASKGITILDLDDPNQIGLIQPPSDLDQINDLSIADGFLFALDATPNGHLAVFSLKDPGHPVQVGQTIEVPVGPFSGVSAAKGIVVVSGGTSQLTLREYLTNGHLGEEIVTADYGRGQPDVLVSNDGKHLFVSTHYFGPQFGLTLSDVTRSPLRLKTMASLPIEGAGFTSGGFKPANFPMDLAINKNTLFLGYEKGLAVISTEDLRSPTLESIIPLPFKAVNVDVFNNLVAVCGKGKEIQAALYRIQNHGPPILIHSYSFDKGASPTGIALNERHVVVALQGKGFKVFNHKNEDLTI